MRDPANEDGHREPRAVAEAVARRSYGKLLILDCGRGYHVVLSGFERLDAQVGQALGAGAPVGVMPGWDPRATAIRPALSVELRHAGEPINPLPFLG